MKGMSAGETLILTATVDGVDLVAVGWKFKKKSNQLFVCTRGAGSTEPTNVPYFQRFDGDDYHNVHERPVGRPYVLSKYYTVSNVIDTHNQVRQSEIKLEKKWVTKSGWFRVFTTLVGIQVVDSVRLYSSLEHREAYNRT